MSPNDALATGGEAYVLAHPEGSPIAVYRLEGGSTRLDLGVYDGSYAVHWYDPRRGGALQAGSVDRVEGAQVVGLGQPPTEADTDWVILLRREQQ
jgi:hypothetical protein